MERFQVESGETPRDWEEDVLHRWALMRAKGNGGAVRAGHWSRAVVCEPFQVGRW